MSHDVISRESSDMNHSTLIAIAVVEWNGSFLVGKRPAGVPLPGLCEFPGGKVESGESPAQAAIRECFEETGLAVEILGRYPTEEHAYDHGCVQLHFFSCTPLAPDAIPLGSYQWVARSDLATLEFPAGNRALIEMLCTGRASSPLET